MREEVIVIDPNLATDEEMTRALNSLALQRLRLRLEEFMSRGGGRKTSSHDNRPVRQVRGDLNELIQARKQYDREQAELNLRTRDWNDWYASELMAGDMRSATTAIAPYVAAALTLPLAPQFLGLTGLLYGAASPIVSNFLLQPSTLAVLNGVNAAGAAYNLGSDNGIPKTIRMAKQYGVGSPEFVRSLLGDGWNAAVGFMSGAGLMEQMPNMVKLGRAVYSPKWTPNLGAGVLLDRGTRTVQYAPPTRTTGVSPLRAGLWQRTTKPSPVRITVAGGGPKGPRFVETEYAVPPIAETPVGILPFAPGYTEAPVAPVPVVGVGQGQGWRIPEPVPDYGSVETHDPNFESWFMQQEPGSVANYGGVDYLIQWSKDPWRHDVDPRTERRSSSYLGDEEGDYTYRYSDGRKEDESDWQNSSKAKSDYNRAKSTGKLKVRK